MYANAAGIVPVIQVFVAKGIPLGTAIAFMMGTIGLPAGSNPAQKGNDHETDPDLFWGGDHLYHIVRAIIQPYSINKQKLNPT
jgi:hypothetical protein